MVNLILRFFMPIAVRRITLDFRWAQEENTNMGTLKSASGEGLLRFAKIEVPSGKPGYLTKGSSKNKYCNFAPGFCCPSRREEGEYCQYLTDEQRRGAVKDQAKSSSYFLTGLKEQ